MVRSFVVLTNRNYLVDASVRRLTRWHPSLTTLLEVEAST